VDMSLVVVRGSCVICTPSGCGARIA